MKVAVKQNNISSDLNRLKSQLAALNGKRVTIGIHADAGGEIGSDNQDEREKTLRYAKLHEFGGTITAKNVKNLAIPLTKEAKNKSPREIADLIFIVSKKGNPLLVRDKRLHTKKGARRKKADKIYGPPQESELEPLYALKKSVKIPERSYIRASCDAGKGELASLAQTAIGKVIQGKLDPATAINQIGAAGMQMTQNYIRTGRVQPGTGARAQSLKTQHTTLFDQGRLVGSIAYKVDGEG